MIYLNDMLKVNLIFSNFRYIETTCIVSHTQPNNERVARRERVNYFKSILFEKVFRSCLVKKIMANTLKIFEKLN